MLPNVKKDEKGTPVVFWNWINQIDDEEKEKNVPFMRYYTVYNVAQCENIDESKIPSIPAIHNDFDHIAECDEYSGPNRPLNPIEIGHPIRSKSAGYSGANQATHLRS